MSLTSQSVKQGVCVNSDRMRYIQPPSLSEMTLDFIEQTTASTALVFRVGMFRVER